MADKVRFALELCTLHFARDASCSALCVLRLVLPSHIIRGAMCMWNATLVGAYASLLAMTLLRTLPRARTCALAVCNLRFVHCALRFAL